jgi:hypothetical protein
VGVAIPVSSTIKTINIHIYLQYPQYHRHAGIVWFARVRNNSGRAGEVFQWEREENPVENCEKPSPSTEMKVFEVFSVAGPELFPNRNCS